MISFLTITLLIIDSQGKIMATVTAIDSSFIITSPIVNQADQYNSDVAVRWQPPDDSLMALNTDGAVVEHGTKAVCGGVMRDCNENFLVAYAARIHPCSVLEAEFGVFIMVLRLHGSWIQ